MAARWVVVAHALLAFIALSAATGSASAQEKVPTCIYVESNIPERDELTRLVASEVDRHPSHRAVTSKCSTHLKVELIDIGGERFLTGRVDGEVPDRVLVTGKDGKALERAIEALLVVVLGNEPVALEAPGGHSWLSERLLTLRDHSRSTLDVALLEGGALILPRVSFASGALVGYSREIADWQVGVEGLALERFGAHPGRLELDTQIRLQAVVTYFFSADADVSGFMGVSLGLAHQRFSGPRAPEVGPGDGAYNVTGPGLGLRGGVELFRTTTTRAFLLAEAFVPLFVANDQEGETVKAWVPGFTLGTGVRF